MQAQPIIATTYEPGVFQSLNTAWERRGTLLRWALMAALLSFLVFIVFGSQQTFSSLVRIEPEISTTGEQTSIDAEIDIIRSWATVSAAVKSLDRSVLVKPVRSETLARLSLLARIVYSKIVGARVAYNETALPGVRIDRFHISGDEQAYLGRAFLLRLGTNETYSLYAPNGRVILQGVVGQLAVGRLDDGAEVQITMGDAQAAGGEKFSVVPVADDYFTQYILERLNATRKGFRERSGLIEVTFKDQDSVFARQMLDHLVSTYLAQAYDRSSLGKIRALTKLEAESYKLREKARSAEEELQRFKQENQTIDLTRETQSALDRRLQIQESLSNYTSRYKELSVSLTPAHPSVQAVKVQLDYYTEQLRQLDQRINAMPEQERRLFDLNRNLGIANDMLKVNTSTIAALSAEVESITGYARLVSPGVTDVSSPLRKAFAALLLGFALGAVIGVACFTLKGLPVFAFIGSEEDLREAVALPVAAVFPSKPESPRWIWDREREEKTAEARRSWVKKSVQTLHRLERQTPFLQANGQDKIVLWTSMREHQGVPFCARFYADASAERQKTLIVDANMMRPALHKHYRFAPSPGLSDILAGQASVKETLQSTDNPQLFVMPAGTQTPNYRLLADSERLGAIFAELSANFDRIIIEFPPLTPALRKKNALVGMADVVFLVVKQGMHTQELTEGVKQAGLDGHKASYLVLNRA